ncbi:KIF5C protein [Oopsacas minuta]|uniref:KIF5C protein n=1 Tax=Oopsacas minuta TaxID=111878 RepID=A0AAV7JAE2_9METZ|nr:KIF5C protein [Oopsacas minuta]
MLARKESTDEDEFHSPVRKSSFFQAPPFSAKRANKKSSVVDETLPDLFLSQSSASDKTDSKQNFKVCVRVRPLIPREHLTGSITCVDLPPDQQTVQIYKPSPTTTIDGNPNTLVQTPDSNTTKEHTFSFDRVYGPATTQLDLYSTAVRPVVLNILEGYNGSIIAYGQTSAGKTYTMEGGQGGVSDVTRGIIPRVAEEIFSYIEKSSNSASRFLVRASFMQLYNEQLQDLLHPPRQGQPKQPLKIREVPTGIYVQGLSESVAKGPQDIIELMRRGSQHRITASTQLNWSSSRSHALFSIIVEHSEVSTVSKKKVITIGKLNLVDLAGSERVKDSGAEGERFGEACKINSSLTSLGKVILALTARGKGQLHVPYRDTKITFLLRDSLGGNCRTTLITNITPAGMSYSETLSTLRFGNNAKSVRNDARINQDMSEQGLLLAYERELQKLRNELETASHKQGGNQDNGRLEVLEYELRGAHEINEQVQQTLREREQEIVNTHKEQNKLREKISTMEQQLLVGGTQIQEMPEFREAVREVEQEVSRQFEERIRSLEKERERERSEKEQLLKRLETFEVSSASPPQTAWEDTTHASLQKYVDAMSNPETGIPQLGPDISVGFCGQSAVKWFQSNMLGVSDNEQAVKVGQQLMEYGVILGASGREIFSDGEFDLFQFSPEYCGISTSSPVKRVSAGMVRTPSFTSELYRPSSREAYSSYLNLSPSPPSTAPDLGQFGGRPHAYSAMSMNADSLYESSGSSGGLSALHSAAGRGETILVKSLVPTYGVDCRDQSGRTSLMHSVIGGRHRCVSMLLKMRADIHTTDVNGRTALLWAAYYGHLEVLKVLIKHDKRVLDFTDPEGRTALHWATKPDNVDCLRLVAKHCSKDLITLQDKDDSNALMWAVLCGHPVHLNILLKQCPLSNLSQGDTMGHTPLHYAVGIGQESCCQVILKHAPEVALIPDIHGRCPIHLAITETNSLEVLHTLLSLGHKYSGINSTDKKMATALHWAAALNKLDMVKLLLEFGAVPDCKDLRGYTPLHYALNKSHKEVVKVFEQLERPVSSLSTVSSVEPSNQQTLFQRVIKN